MSDKVNQQAIQGNWNEIRGQLRSKWGQLTGDDLQTFNGNVDQLVGLIQRKTGEARSSVERYLEELATSGPPTIGRFELREKLGEGGLGTVYLAHDRQLDRSVALKIPAFSTSSEAERQRFLREARAAARLEHPGIVPVYEAGEAQGVTYLARAYVDGSDLASLLNEKGPLPLTQAVEVVRQAAEGLEYAHRLGVVHQDLKPSNLFLRQTGTEAPKVFIADFGLGSHAARTEKPLAVAHSFAGTSAYVPPESFGRADLASPMGDVYSLGCTLFELATGKPPAGDASPMHMAQRYVVGKDAPRLSSVVPESPRALDSLVQRMLATRPEDRPVMSDVAAELEKIGHGLSATLSKTRSAQPITSTQAQATDTPSPDLCIGLSLSVSVLAALATSLLAWNLTTFLVLTGVLAGIHASLWLFVEGFRTSRSSVFRVASFIAGCFLLWEVMQLLATTIQ